MRDPNDSEDSRFGPLSSLLLWLPLSLLLWAGIAWVAQCTYQAAEAAPAELLCRKADLGSQRPEPGQTLAYWIGDLTDTGVTVEDVHAAAAEWNAFWTSVHGHPVLRYVYSDAWTDIRVLASPTVNESTEVLMRCYPAIPAMMFEPYWTDLRLSHGMGQWWNRQALAHEFGHTIGFRHTVGGVMDPNTHLDSTLATKWSDADAALVAGYYGYP